MSRTWALLERVEAPDINDPARTVMVRWRIVQTPLFGICLHRLDGPDQRSTLHDHPWPFLSTVLRGGYTEEFGHTSHSHTTVTTSRRHGSVVERVTRSWRAGSIHRMRAHDPHTITALRRTPTWTLVLAGPRYPDPGWGYWDETGWTGWNEHPHAADFETAQAARQDMIAADGRLRAAYVRRRIAVGLLLATVAGAGFLVSERAWGPAAFQLCGVVLAGRLLHRARRQIKEARGRLGAVAR